MYKTVKRLIDILLSIIAMILFLPLFIPIAIGLRLTGEGYIFYHQDRIGYLNKKFRIWKFATMLKASPGLGTGSITVKNDWRLTPMGAFLRKTKLNEIPQVINVFLGSMSIVGPRPQMEVDFLKYPERVRERVNNVKPGITGVASVFFRDEEQYFDGLTEDPHVFCKRVIAPYKGELELWYQDHIGVVNDTLIVFLTVWVILFPQSRLPEKMFKGLPDRPEELR
jgi:lipopolysaccharide/colanic/teichoic acid biosynthesis glycosyltransferase